MTRHGTKAFGLLSLALLALGSPARAADPARGQPVDVAICLDTSSSMDGLIGSAKQKLWDIVNDLSQAKPTPRLRVAVYSYGNNAHDAKAGWVRQEIELTSDLDKVSEKLHALQATRVSNSEEYAARVCRDAVEKLKWSDDRKALRVVFVCGNESVSQDPDVQLKDVAQAALRKDIVINTIYCNPAGDSLAPGWKEFAQMAEGRFAAIDQNRTPAVVATPQDKELAELSARLNATFCFYGKEARQLQENQKRQDDNALKLGGATASARAQSKSSDLYGFGGKDLVEQLKQNPKFDVKLVAENELSDEMKKMTPEQREKHVRSLLAKREELQKQIAAVAKKREAYIEAERRKNPNPGEKAFDEAVRGALREQAKKKGFEVPR